MGRRLRPLLFVTGNPIKISRLQAAFEAVGGVPFECVDLQTREIQACTVKEVAEDKAQQAFKVLQCPLVVHDVGLWVDALGGFPGPYTAYAAKTLGVQGLLGALDACAGATRLCSWHECISYIDGKGTIHSFEATVPGNLATHAPDSGVGLTKV